MDGHYVIIRATSKTGGPASLVLSCTRLSCYRNSDRFNDTFRVIFGQGLLSLVDCSLLYF